MFFFVAIVSNNIISETDRYPHGYQFLVSRIFLKVPSKDAADDTNFVYVFIFRRK